MAIANSPRVAVIGLGSMGFGMATSLRRAGLDVTGCDVSADAVARFVADGGGGAKTPAEKSAFMDTLARVKFMQGNKADAIALEQKALAQADDNSKEKLQHTLDSYEKGELPEAE